MLKNIPIRKHIFETFDAIDHSAIKMSEIYFYRYGRSSNVGH